MQLAHRTTGGGPKEDSNLDDEEKRITGIIPSQFSPIHGVPDDDDDDDEDDDIGNDSHLCAMVGLCWVYVRS